MKKNTKIDALQLAARFSLPPNSKGYCGRDSAPEKFKKCLLNCECEGVSEELKKFIVLTPYLKTLSEISGKKFDSYEVIESYWLGNDLLESVKNKDFNLLLKNFKVQGVPDWYIRELRVNKPEKFIPMHQFQVFHVGVGKASGSIPHNLDSSNNCMIRWGKVLKVSKQKALVQINKLEIKDGKYALAIAKKPEELVVQKYFTHNLSVNDIVAVHWNEIIKILSARELYNLDYWTNEVIKTVNPPVFKQRDHWE